MCPMPLLSSQAKSVLFSLQYSVKVAEPAGMGLKTHVLMVDLLV